MRKRENYKLNWKEILKLSHAPLPLKAKEKKLRKRKRSK